MAYDEGLVERVRGVLEERQDVSEKRMFGGIAFMVRGHMCVGVTDSRLMVRVGSDAHAELAGQPHARPMDFTGRPMKGFLYVAAAGVERDADLERWVGRALRYVTSLPAKEAAPKRIAAARIRRPRTQVQRTRARQR